jgi:predicted PurR-regulated permease PerM
VVAIFNGLAAAVAFELLGVPHPLEWAAITGGLSLVPFLGYAAVVALALRLAIAGAGAAAVFPFVAGCAVLFAGDKVVRPIATRGGTHLGFAWVLMGCVGGFEVLGLVGVVVGPVVLSLTRELWRQRVRDLSGGGSA